MAADTVLSASVTINGKVKILISADDELGQIVLKRKFVKIEVTSTPITVGDKVIPIGSLMISEE